MSKEAPQAHKAAAAIRRLKEDDSPYGTKPPEESRSPHWSHVRELHLQHDKSCNVCGGSQHLQVHHVRPFHLFPALELDDSNLITLCESPGHNCHLWWGHLLSWPAWNPLVRQQAADMAKEIQNRPKA